ncbi:hypothetical protein BC629DRAFT_1270015, partial [Irpex lacteus]
SPSSGTDLKWAPAPFDKPTADVILQSSDNVHFRVRKGILAEASSVFDELFTHATPALNASLRCGDEMIDGVPVITMTETSSVLTFILHLSYPPSEVQHTLDNMDDALGAMTASHKYMMPYAEKVAAKQLALVVAKDDAIRVYAVACKRGMPEVMEIAARIWLDQPSVHESIAELADISAMDYHNLLKYREACSVAATRVA